MTIVCGPPIYQYNGWVLEIHSYSGPHPLDEDWCPLEYGTFPDSFYDDVQPLMNMNKEQREEYRVGGIGGCQVI